MPLLGTQALDVAIAGNPICSELDLEIRAGQCWGVLGRNGAGKTTLLLTLAGLRPAQQGEIRLDGESLHNLPRRRIARRLGVLFQDYSDPFPATVLETALIGRHPHLGRLDWESARDLSLAREALRQVGLEDFEQRPVGTLSGGERRRLAIATLLTQDPALALLDEPVNHLDLNFQIRMLDQLSQRAKRDGGAVMMVLHDVNLAHRFCDRLLLMFGNGETQQGPASEIATEANLERLYDHPVTTVAGPRGPVMVPL